MKAVLPALAGVLLCSIVLAAALAPAWRSDVDGGHQLWGGLEGLPNRGTLLIQAPRSAYTPDEVAAARNFLDHGGRLLVIEPTAPANSLLLALDVGLTAPGGLVFDPDVDAEGRFTAYATGTLGITQNVALARSQVVLGDGASLLSTGPFVWHDQDADGRPDVEEPRGAWSIAQLRSVGNGSALVLGSAALLDHPATRTAIAQWMADGGPLVVDARHIGGPDAFGATSTLAGHRPGAILALLVVGTLVAAAFVFAVRVQRVGGRRRRGPVDRQTLEILAELSD